MRNDRSRIRFLCWIGKACARLVAKAFSGMVLPVVERTPPDVETLHYRQSVVHVEYM